MFGGALPNTELLKGYGIQGPLQWDKVEMLREERMQIIFSHEVIYQDDLYL
jgi:hypothetical protein